MRISLEVDEKLCRLRRGKHDACIFIDKITSKCKLFKERIDIINDSFIRCSACKIHDKHSDVVVRYEF